MRSQDVQKMKVDIGNQKKRDHKNDIQERGVMMKEKRLISITYRSYVVNLIHYSNAIRNTCSIQTTV